MTPLHRLSRKPHELRLSPGLKWRKSSQTPGGPTAPKYAVPARTEDLTGLPPAWVGTGTLDLFYEENVEYVRRLQASGVPCELHEVPGAYHAFEIFAGDAAISREFIARQVSALKRALTAAG